MAHVALYRKYRSQTFGDLVGQDHVVRTLQHSIEQGKISHAYLFTGPRGTGKTSAARLLAKALNCTGGPSVDIPDDCPICEEITAGNCLDVVEIDAASEAKADDVREHIVQASEYQPAQCRYRIFIIDEVHDLSAKAFDVLLKTIEEPPEHVVFILATTEFHKVPQTIRSRCQRFDFHRGTLNDLSDRLSFVADSEGVEIEPSAVTAIARMADGGYRDALTLLEQAVITAEGKVTLDHVYHQLGLVADETADGLLLGVAEQDVKGIIEKTEEIYRTGRDPRAIVESLLHRLSDLTRSVYQLDVGSGDAAVEAGLTATAARIGADKLLVIRGLVSQLHKDIRDVSLPRIWLEAEMVRVSQMVNGVGVAPAAAQPEIASAGGQKAVVQQKATKPQQSAGKPSAQQLARQKQASAGVERVTAGQPGIKEKPVATVAVPKGNGGPDDVVWGKVVQALGAVSKTAAMRLPKSMVQGREGNVVTIGFERTSDAEWVEDNKKVHQAILAEWKKQGNEEVNFRFVGSGANGNKKAGGPDVGVASVESPVEGERLADTVKEVFNVQDNK